MTAEREWLEPDWVRLEDISNIALPRETLNGQPEREDSWLPINLGELDEQPPTPPTLGNIGVIYAGKRHVFSGPQESAKTLVAYAFGIEVLRHNDGTLILIDFEMGRWDARNRLLELGATHADLRRIHYIEPHEPAVSDTMGRLVRLDPALVIIDAAAGAYDLQGLDDNKRQDVGRFTSLYVQEFWRHEIATIVLDHVVKNTETRGKYAIGSERKVGGADVHLGFEVITPIQRGQTGLYKIVTHKDRGGFLQRGKLADLTLSSATDTHQITWTLKAAEHVEEGEIWMPTTLMTKVSAYLSLLHEPVPRARILDDVQGRGPIVRRAIDHLVRLGYASETPGERGAKLIEHTRLFHENDLPKPPPSDLVPPSSHMVPGTGSFPPSAGSSPPYRGNVLNGDDVEQLKTDDLVPEQAHPEPDERPPPDESTYQPPEDET